DALLFFQEFEGFFNNLEGQANVAGQIEAEHDALDVKRAQQELVEERERQARFLKAIRRRRCFGHASSVNFQSFVFRGDHGETSMGSFVIFNIGHFLNKSAMPMRTKTIDIWMIFERLPATSWIRPAV